jgi:hypothetical protein
MSLLELEVQYAALCSDSKRAAADAQSAAEAVSNTVYCRKSAGERRWSTMVSAATDALRVAGILTVGDLRRAGDLAALQAIGIPKMVTGWLSDDGALASAAAPSLFYFRYASLI